jgi:hypothetical protein
MRVRRRAELVHDDAVVDADPGRLGQIEDRVAALIHEDELRVELVAEMGAGVHQTAALLDTDDHVAAHRLDAEVAQELEQG